MARFWVPECKIWQPGSQTSWLGWVFPPKHCCTASTSLSHLFTPASTAYCSASSGTWLIEAKSSVHSDIDDIWGYPSVALLGCAIFQEMRELGSLAASLRQQQLLRKFYLQLVTFTLDRVPEMEPPFGPSQEQVLLELLETQKACLLYTSPSPRDS